MSDITPRQKRFCDQYLIDLNGTQAAIRAGYSKKTAKEQAVRLLSNVNLRDYIDKRMKDREIRTEITQDRVLQEYAKIAFVDVRKLFDDKNALKQIDMVDDETAGAIAGIETLDEFSGCGDQRTKIGVTNKIKLIDKKGALDSLAKHLGMFTDRTENINVDMTYEQYINKVTSTDEY